MVTDDVATAAGEAADSLEQRLGVRLTEQQVMSSPHIYIGSVESLTEKVIGLRESLRISSFMVGELGPMDEVVQRLSGT